MRERVGDHGCHINILLSALECGEVPACGSASYEGLKREKEDSVHLLVGQCVAGSKKHK